MGRVDKRLKELENKQEEFLSHLKGLDCVDKQPVNDENNLGQERKVILRELTDVKIRIRNLQRNRKRGEVALKNVNLPPDCENKCSKVEPVHAAIGKDDVVPEDDSFNPEAVKLNLNRPEMRIYPKIPLPHSQPFWDRVARVGRRRERTGGRLTDWHGQFTGVEEEEDRLKKMQERDGWRWNWNKTIENYRIDEEFRSWGEVNVEGFCRLDSDPPLVKSSGKESATSESSLETSSSDQIQASNQGGGVNTALPDIAELKKLFPLNKSAAPEVSPPDHQDTQQSSPSTEQVFTKIKSRVNDQLVSRIKSILNQNLKIDSKPAPSAEASKPCVVFTGTHGMTTKSQVTTSKVAVGEDFKSRQEEQKLSRGSAPPPVTSKMITVRAKLVSPPVPSPLLTSNDATTHPEALRKKLRKRLMKN